jgi:hypothetical protein
MRFSTSGFLIAVASAAPLALAAAVPRHEEEVSRPDGQLLHYGTLHSYITLSLRHL